MTFTNLNSSILVVDDEIEIRELITDHLQFNGFKNIVTADNGLQALDIIKTTSVHLILSDLLMPKMNGIDLYYAIQSLETRPHFILISGSDLEDVHSESEQSFEFIQKPFDFDQLVKRVRDICTPQDNPSTPLHPQEPGFAISPLGDPNL